MQRLFRLFLLLVVIACMPMPAIAQYPFGKNKVIYNKRDWKVLKTEHVDIYHYPTDANVILYLAPLVEETFNEYSETFNLDFSRRLPFVFYNTHYDFQQTNILPYLISEGTGGFTDLIKGRIAVPFTGSYANLRHVVRHEMVHAFMLEKIKQVMHDHGKFNFSQPPLWFVEGMAEYFATAPQNTQGNMFVRDALVNNRLLGLDQIWRIQGSFMMYKEGEAVINYIATSFGPEAVVQILENWWTAPEFSLVLVNTINMDLVQLNDAFMKHVKRRYYPSILNQTFASDIGQRLSRPRSFHSRPVAAVDENGDLHVYAICAKDFVINVCGGVVRDGIWDERSIAKGARSATLESIPAFRSKLEVHGDTLMFVSKSNERDVIYFWSIDDTEPVERFSFDGLGLLSSPTLSPDHSRMVFSAIDASGKMDLFMYHFEREQLERLTNDGFSEEDPDYHPSRDVVLFTSDRGAGGVRDRTHIYEMDLRTREIRGIEGGAFADYNPEWAPDGESFLFVSDREGTANVYHHSGNVIVRQTNVLGGATHPAFLPGGDSFLATVYENGEFNVYEFPIKNGNGRMLATMPPDTTIVPWSRGDYDEEEFVTQDYKMKLGVDFVGAGVAIDPEAGDVGNGGQMLLTDVLGNHQFSLVFGTTTEDVSNFWKQFNAAVSYVNLQRRLNFSVSLFHLNSNTIETVTSKREKRVGGAFGVSYPLSKFRRLDGSVVLRHIQQDDIFSFVGLTERESVTGSLFGTYVVDNTLWTIGGPLLGWRYFITAGQTVDFNGRGFDNTSLQVDVRRYFKLTSRIVFATRYVTRNSWGSETQVFYIGGPWTLRGYRYREFFGRTTHLFNTEIRFPLIDNLSLAFPFGVIEMPMFRGAIFFDAGRALRNNFQVLDTEWLGTLGTGVELNLGFAPVIRVNFTWPTDFDTISGKTGFELFIGYNY